MSEIITREFYPIYISGDYIEFNINSNSYSLINSYLKFSGTANIQSIETIIGGLKIESIESYDEPILKSAPLKIAIDNIEIPLPFIPGGVILRIKLKDSVNLSNIELVCDMKKHPDQYFIQMNEDVLNNGGIIIPIKYQTLKIGFDSISLN